ncbi:unnamed protein product, partial [Didymodactylos carnosus]
MSRRESLKKSWQDRVTRKERRTIWTDEQGHRRIRNTDARDYSSMNDRSKLDEVPWFIKPESLYLYNNVILLDTRNPKSYETSHIRNSVNVHDIFTYLLKSSEPKDIENMRNHFQQRLSEVGITGDLNEHVVLYEQGMNKNYGSSCRGFFLLKWMHHPNVSVLQGGLDAFLQTDVGKMQMTNELPTIKQCVYNGQDDTNDWLMAHKNDILDVLNNKRKAHLLDVRDAAEWQGLTSSPYGIDFSPRKGRILNSIWIE